jgi:hypothetical protein
MLAKSRKAARWRAELAQIAAGRGTCSAFRLFNKAGQGGEFDRLGTTIIWGAESKQRTVDTILETI